eukprot:312121-Amorphochlora_amoeboformis.AAC.1
MAGIQRLSERDYRDFRLHPGIDIWESDLVSHSCPESDMRACRRVLVGLRPLRRGFAGHNPTIFGKASELILCVWGEGWLRGGKAIILFF